jgi:hypothetical protein
VLLTLFLATWVGQSLVGLYKYNADEEQHGQPAVSYWRYLRTPHFAEATFENWESEFLQMGAFVVLTVGLRQKGSAESKNCDDEPEEVDRDPAASRHKPDAPWPVRQGGWAMALYSNSLSIALGLLFLVCFVGHAASGAREYSQEQIEHGERAVTTLQYLGTSQFWFESLQNWQSEFLSIAVMVIFTIWLRQKGSAESKPVDAPHAETGK